MPNMTLSLDAETYRLIKSHPGVNWSHVARQAFRRKIAEVHVWDELLKDSDLTMDDAIRLGDEAKESMARRMGWMR